MNINDRVYLLTDAKPGLFSRAKLGKILAKRARRVYVAFDDGTGQWCALAYVHVGDVPNYLKEGK